MTRKHKRVIGTTLEAIAKAETELGRSFPPSFRAWLLENNGLSVDDVYVFPVLDERDVRKTWDSIVRHYDSGQWFPDYFEDEGLTARHLLPFASLGSGDYYCFDYNRQRQDGETPIVWWSHESAKTEDRTETFTEFVEKVEGDVYDD